MDEIQSEEKILEQFWQQIGFIKETRARIAYYKKSKITVMAALKATEQEATDLASEREPTLLALAKNENWDLYQKEQVRLSSDLNLIEKTQNNLQNKVWDTDVRSGMESISLEAQEKELAKLINDLQSPSSLQTLIGQIADHKVKKSLEIQLRKLVQKELEI